MRFTKANIGGLRLPAGKSDFVHFDNALPGFGLRIRSSGKRTWVIHKRTKEGVLKRTIGDASLFGLDDARNEARKVLGRAQKLDLLDDHERRKEEDELRRQAEERARGKYTLAKVAELYIAQHVEIKQKARTQLETKRHLRSHWATFHETPLHTISRRDISSRLTAIARDNGPIAANRARSTLGHLFIWSMQQGLVEQNPVIGTSKPGKETARNRVLKPDELRSIWRATDYRGDYNSIVRLLMLTGQRREEVAGLCWSEVDFDRSVWTLPGERTKNGLPHEVPLSKQALQILGEQPRRLGGGKIPRDLMFGRGNGPFSGWSRSKARLDDALSVGSGQEKALISNWRIHDLRRTMVTMMAERLDVLPHVIESVVNHVSGHKAGVAGIYNRATYAKEERLALHIWADYLDDIVKT
jgi:integrase